MTEIFDQWWALTTATYEFIWPAIPFAIGLGLLVGLTRCKFLGWRKPRYRKD